MADDPYVPVGGWEAAGYSGFSPYQPAVQNYGTTYQNTGITPTYTAPQQLATTDNSYAQLRGWDPSPYAYGNSGPALQGQGWALSDGYQYANNTSSNSPGAASPSYSSYGGNYNDQFNAPYSPPAQSFDQFLTSQGYQNNGGTWGRDNGDSFGALGGGDLSGLQSQFNSIQSGGAGLLGGLTGPYGDLSGSQNFSTLPGGNYNDASNAPYTPPYGDLSGVSASPIDTSYQNPATAYQMPTSGSTFGDLSGSQGVATGGASLAGYQPQPTYADPAGGAGLAAGQDSNPTYGDLSGSQNVATGGADMSAGNPFDISNFQNSYPPAQQNAAQIPGPTIDPSTYQAPSTGAQMPQITTPNTYGSLSNAAATGGAQLGSFDDFMRGQGYSMGSTGDGEQGWKQNGGETGLDTGTLSQLQQQYQNSAVSSAQYPPQQNSYGDLSGFNRGTLTNDYTGGAGISGGTQSAYAGQWPNAVQSGGSQSTTPDFNQLPTPSSPAAIQAGQDIGSTQYSSYPLDRSQVPTSTVAPGTQLGDLPYPNDAERMRLMRTINGEDPQNPEAILWSIQNRLATGQMPDQARYGNTIGTGVGPNNNGTDVVTRGNQYNAFSQSGYNADNFANNVAGFNETNPNYQRYSDAIDSVWNAPSSQDPTSGATNYFNPNTSQPAWQQQLAQQNSQQIGAHTYVGQTPLFTPPLPPPRPDSLDPYQMPQVANNDGRFNYTPSSPYGGAPSMQAIAGALTAGQAGAPPNAAYSANGIYYDANGQAMFR